MGSNVLSAELRGRKVGRLRQGRLLVASGVARVGRRSSAVVARERRGAVTLILRLVSVRALLLARVELLLLMSIVGAVVLPELGLVVLPVASLLGLSVLSSVTSSSSYSVADVAAPRVKVSRLVVVAALSTLLRERLGLPLLISFVGLLLSLLEPRTKAKGQSRPFALLKQEQQQEKATTHPDGS